MAALACFLGQFSWKHFSQHFNLMCCLPLSLMCVSHMQQNAGSYSICSLLACLFNGEMGPLMLRDIKDKRLLVRFIFVVSGEFMFDWFSSAVIVVS